MADKKQPELETALAVINESQGLKETPETIRSWKHYPAEQGETGPGKVAVVISDYRKFTVDLATRTIIKV
jgi:hypothetical protein